VTFYLGDPSLASSPFVLHESNVAMRSAITSESLPTFRPFSPFLRFGGWPGLSPRCVRTTRASESDLLINLSPPPWAGEARPKKKKSCAEKHSVVCLRPARVCARSPPEARAHLSSAKTRRRHLGPFFNRGYANSLSQEASLSPPPLGNWSGAA